jgi:hypothetical protein
MPPKSTVPYYDWKYHGDNKWWTFQKGEGKTTTRFGRFEDRQFITGNPSTPASTSVISPQAAAAAAVISAPAVLGTAACPIVIND